MLTKLYNRIQETAKKTIEVVNGIEYSTQGPLTPIRRNTAETIKLNTLESVCDWLKAEELVSTDKLLIHVASPAHVQVLGFLHEKDRDRDCFVNASPISKSEFPFGVYKDLETMIIALQTLFAPTSDRDELIAEISNIGCGETFTSSDDGVSQEVTIKAGVHRLGTKKIKPIVNLAPYRTFPEIEQPVSQYLFRVRGGGEKQPPQVALFGADGGQWKLEAIKSIAEYFRNDPVAKSICILA